MDADATAPSRDEIHHEADTMVSSDPISDYMQRHACGFPEALEALAAQLGPPTDHDIRHALQTLG
jgi:hypothetical protein